MNRDVRLLAFALALLTSACKRDEAAKLPSAAAPPDAAPPVAVARDAGAPAPARVPARRVPVEDGVFLAAQFVNRAPVLARVRALPDAVLASDQRAGAAVEPGDDEAGVALPLSQAGVLGTKRLALVEARSRPDVSVEEKEASIDVPLVAWFEAKPARMLPRPAGNVARYRQWKGVDMPVIEPEVLTVEDARGTILGVRLLGAVHDLRPVTIDETVPMFLATILENASGIDDAVSLRVIGFVDGDLRELARADAGPRSVMAGPGTAAQVIGPAGSMKVEGGALRVLRIVDKGPDAPCTPGGLAAAGCEAEEVSLTWRRDARRFEEGPKKPIVLQQSPDKPPTVKPR